MQGTHLTALLYTECIPKLAGGRKVQQVAGLSRVSKGLGFGTSHMCVLREAGLRCQRI